MIVEPKATFPDSDSQSGLKSVPQKMYVQAGAELCEAQIKLG